MSATTAECPKCGYVGAMRAPQANKTPMWVLELRSVARSREPIFGGLLERDVWREDATIVRFLNEGWIEAEGVKGFRITQEGRKAYERLAREYNLPPL